MLVLLPLVLLATAVLLYVGMRGRSVKEAQANVSVLMFAASILPVAADVHAAAASPPWLLAVPIAGQFALLCGASCAAIPLRWTQLASEAWSPLLVAAARCC